MPWCSSGFRRHPAPARPGTYPVASLDDYEARVPADRSQWKTVDVPPRPFPAEWRPVPSPREAALVNKPIVNATALTAGIGFVVMVTRRQFLTGRTEAHRSEDPS